MNSLKPLKHTVRLLDDFFVFDVETAHKKKNKKGETIYKWALTGKFVFGVVYGKNYTRVIHSIKEFHEEFQHPRYKGKKVFAHNAEFDLTILYGNIFKTFPDAIFNGRFISASNGNCSFANSLNIYKTKASTIGEMLGILKTGMQGDGTYTQTNWNNVKQKANAINGCIRDCEIIWEALFRIFEKVGSIKITQASLSLDYFKRFFLETAIAHNENTSFFYDSYFGGRCEAFKIGKFNKKDYGEVDDVNSMYPWGMKTAIFPDPKYLKIADDITVKKFLSYYLKRFEGCVYCTVYHKGPDEHKNGWIGHLPVKRGGKLLFPVGTIKGVWNFNEIRYPLESGIVEILDIERIVYAPAMTESPFVKYVDTLYRERFSSDNEFHIYVIKIFMNSLYGKFAQRIDEEWIYIEDVEKQVHVIQQYEKANNIIKIVPFNSERNDCFLVVGSDNDWCKDFAIPAFASYITSFCRVHLLKGCIEVGEKRLIYCDTDSRFKRKGGKATKDDLNLGGWKKEKKLITGVFGLKNYTVKEWDKKKKRWKKVKEKIKGIPERATKHWDRKEQKFKYRYVNLVKTKESLRRGIEPGSEVERFKVLKNTYTKRIVDKKTGNTKPIIFYE